MHRKTKHEEKGKVFRVRYKDITVYEARDISSSVYARLCELKSKYRIKSNFDLLSTWVDFGLVDGMMREEIFDWIMEQAGKKGAMPGEFIAGILAWVYEQEKRNGGNDESDGKECTRDTRVTRNNENTESTEDIEDIEDNNDDNNNNNDTWL